MTDTHGDGNHQEQAVINEVLELAEAIAREAHFEQREPEGRKRDYIEHVAGVVSLMDDPWEKVVAWLHDVIEDTDIDALELVERGIPAPLVRSVVRLSRLERSVTYREYIGDLIDSHDVLAMRVKVADIREHLDPSCPPRLRPRYEAALAHLVNALSTSGDGLTTGADSAGSGAPRTVNAEARDASSAASSVAPLPSELDPPMTLEYAAREVLRRFEADEREGYRSRDRQYAITLLRQGLKDAADPALRALSAKWRASADRWDVVKAEGEFKPFADGSAKTLRKCATDLDRVHPGVSEGQQDEQT